MVQSTFTKQKRELAKAANWISKLRAMEIHNITFSPEGEKLSTEKESYVEFSAVEICTRVMETIQAVVEQHGARQMANSKNTGHFSWHGIEAELTVPKLRVLQEAHKVFNELVQNLPRKNSKRVPNTTVEGHPAFAHPPQKHFAQKVRYTPYEESDSTRIRTYEQRYEEHTHTSQRIEIDYGLDVRTFQVIEELVMDLDTAIQVAIDEANARGREKDPVLTDTIDGICKVFAQALNPKE